MRNLRESGTRRRLLFSDPTECHDLALSAAPAERLNLWRKRLMDELANRPEGFTDGKNLVPGRPYPRTLPHAHGEEHST